MQIVACQDFLDDESRYTVYVQSNLGLMVWPGGWNALQRFSGEALSSLLPKRITDSLIQRTGKQNCMKYPNSLA